MLFGEDCADPPVVLGPVPHRIRRTSHHVVGAHHVSADPLCPDCLHEIECCIRLLDLD